MSVKWIISDVDGCISPEESVPWGIPRFLELAQKVAAANAGRSTLAPLTLCTGRPQPYVEVLMKLFDVRVPAICENGAVLYTLHDNHAKFSAKVTEPMLIGLRALRTFIETDILPENPKVLLQFGKEAQISVFAEDPTLFPPIQAKIERFLADNNGPDLLIQASHFYLNISFTGVDKGSALVELQHELHATREDLAGVGDTEGDLPLRDAVGFFACPANARKAVKDAADYISPYAQIDGMLDILEHPRLQRK